MKRTISKMLGIAALAIIGSGLFGLGTPAHAAEEELTHTNTTGSYIGTWKCYKQTGGAYPLNGKYYFCGNPSTGTVGPRFEGNYASHKQSYVDRMQLTIPNHTKTYLDSPGDVDIYVFCTLKEYQIYFNEDISKPVGVNTDRDWSSLFQGDPFYRRIIIFQYQIASSATQNCGTLTDTTTNAVLDPAKKWPIWSRGPGMMTHEVGHVIDAELDRPVSTAVPPVTQYKHSMNNQTYLWRQYLQKDIDWINSTTRSGKLIPCNNFLVNTFDRFRYTDPNYPTMEIETPFCSNGVLDSHLATNLSNFQLLEKVQQMKYVLTRYTDPPGPVGNPTTFRELFPEEFPYSIPTSGTNSTGTAPPYYLDKSRALFMCSMRYVEIVSKFGRVPNTSDLASPYNRCVLP